MKRSIRWSTYALAFVITAFVFGVGILLGMQLSQQANQQLLQDVSQLRRQTAELEVLTLLSSDPDATASLTSVCPLYVKQATVLNDGTSLLGGKLTALENTRGFQDPETRALKTDYSVLEIRDFLFVKKVNQLCGHSFDTILFFYSNADCGDCRAQGGVVSQVKALQPAKTLVYSFDMDLDSSAVRLLQDTYGVASAPSLVVNGRVLHGLQQKQEILAAMK